MRGGLKFLVFGLKFEIQEFKIQVVLGQRAAKAACEAIIVFLCLCLRCSYTVDAKASESGAWGLRPPERPSDTLSHAPLQQL